MQPLSDDQNNSQQGQVCMGPESARHGPLEVAVLGTFASIGLAEVVLPEALERALLRACLG